jgi:hypothetical protein
MWAKRVTPFSMSWMLAVFCLTTQNAATAAESNVSITIVGADFKYPDTLYTVLSIQPDGSLTAPDTETVDEKTLKEILRRARNVDGKKRCLIRLQTSVEKEVSIELLGKILQRIRGAADPDLPATVYVYMRELKNQERRK